MEEKNIFLKWSGRKKIFSQSGLEEKKIFYQSGP